MSTQLTQDRLAAARADLRAARIAQAHFKERSRLYRDLAAEQTTSQRQTAYTNASVQFSAQADGMTREISDLLLNIEALEREEKGCAVDVTAEQCEAMDDTMGMPA